MKLQARNFVVRKPETIDITMFFKKFCIATRTIKTAAFVRRAAVFLISSLLNCPPRNSAPANYLKKSCKALPVLLYSFQEARRKRAASSMGIQFSICAVFGRGEVLWIWFMKLNEK